VSAITLETIQAKQSELATLIAQFQAQPVNANRQIEVKGQTITLHPGEYYAGAVLDADGHHLHHLVLMAATPGKRLEWQEAMDWAAETGGALPNRQEQALLLANCKPHLKAEWHWSCESNEEDASYAWNCNFDHGHQYGSHKSYEGCAVAVRRL
jgi:hypothetical protein